MPRKDAKEMSEEVKEQKTEIEKAPEQIQEQGIIEVPINLELINNKLNYLISKIDKIVPTVE